MLGEIVAGIIAAVGTAGAAIIGAVALLKRATAPMSRAVVALRGLWTWLETVGHAASAPERLRRDVLRVLDDDDETGAP